VNSRYGLITFLREQLTARAAQAPDIHTAECGYDTLEFLSDCRCGEPGRVLADVEPKRQIIDLHKLGYPGGEPQYGVHWESYNVYNEDGSIRGDREYCVEDDEPRPPYYCETCQECGPCETLRLLALPFAAHPDYREEWRL
jgi:hypothetical protein